MKRRMSPGFFALENLEEQTGLTAAEVDIDSDQQHGDGADAALLEMQDAVGAADENDAAVDELENTVVALESLLETAEASQETGGLDPVAAELLQKAVDNETAPLGTPAEEVVPALESFASASGRRQATVMACEGIKEWIDKVWAKIQEMIQKGRDLMKKAYVAVKQAVQGLERRVGSLKKDAANRNGSLPKSGNVELSSDAWTGGSKSVETLQKLVDGVLGEYATAAIKHANDVATALRAGDAEKAAAAATGGEGDGAAAAETKAEFTIPEVLKAPAAKLGNLANLPGHRKVVKGGDTLVIQAVQGQDKKYVAKPLALDELVKILDGLEAVAKQVTGFEKNFQAKDRAEEGVLAAGKEFTKKAKANDKIEDAAARAAINSAKDAARLLNQPIKDVLSYSATAINGISSFVAANLKMYDKK